MDNEHITIKFARFQRAAVGVEMMFATGNLNGAKECINLLEKSLDEIKTLIKLKEESNGKEKPQSS